MSSVDAHVFSSLSARRLLTRRDPLLKQVIAAVGPCTLVPNPDGLVVLVRSIIAQLISTKAAASVFGRLQAAVGPAGLTPESLLALGENGVRGVGLSTAKTRAILELAEKVRSGELAFDQLANLSDEEVIERLITLRGIGVWTAEMFLIFCLGRPDVLPVADLGLRAGVKELYGLEELPGRVALRERAEPWRPYRSLATWYLWRSRGVVPQSS